MNSLFVQAPPLFNLQIFPISVIAPTALTFGDPNILLVLRQGPPDFLAELLFTVLNEQRVNVSCRTLSDNSSVALPLIHECKPQPCSHWVLLYNALY